MAAGAIWSPALLQVSGIGPLPTLRDLGVLPLVDLPGVGNNLQDHPMIESLYKCKHHFHHKLYNTNLGLPLTRR